MQDLREHLSSEAIKNITSWLEQPAYKEYKPELEKMIADKRWGELEDSFFTVIEFGTAGIRGSTGLGSNKINRVTIGKSTQALCEYAASVDPDAKNKGLVIAYDTRLSSPELSRYTAQVAAANGFKTYIFDSFRSTPELSFAVRHLKAAVGAVISASHNPPIDNGFKAYWSDGGQLLSVHASEVTKRAAMVEKIKSVDFDTAVKSGSIQIIGAGVDEPYYQAVVAEAEGTDRDIDIVYSPLHGAGQTNVLPTFERAGFKSISVVKDQMIPDGNFPTIENGKPNPEEKSANDRAVAQLMAEKADIAITNDPDADRVGVMVRQGEDVIYLSGNQSAVLAADFALKQKRNRGELTPKHYLVKTIVTTDMLGALADAYGVRLYGNLLVGFRYVGEIISDREGTDEVFVLGAEESFGLLKGDYARDKDGATGALPLAEYAAELKKDGMTLYDKLLELYSEHGLYVEAQVNAYFRGASGFQKMQQVMQDLQKNPPEKIGSHEVTAVSNYATLKRHDLKTGEKADIECVLGNVVALELDGDSRRRVTVRPSGTEPKIKLYTQWYEAATGDVEAQLGTANKSLASIGETLEVMLLD